MHQLVSSWVRIELVVFIGERVSQYISPEFRFRLRVALDRVATRSRPADRGDLLRRRSIENVSRS
jgi:hypothetical protein